MAEYHVLAYFYGWAFADLRELPRTHRQSFCYRVKEQVDAENGNDRNGPLDGGAPELISGGKPYIESGWQGV